MNQSSEHEQTDAYAATAAKADDESSSGVSVSRDGISNDSVKDSAVEKERNSKAGNGDDAEEEEEEEEETQRKKKKRSKEDDRESRKHHHHKDKEREKDRKKSKNGHSTEDGAAATEEEGPEKPKNGDEKSRSRDREKDKEKEKDRRIKKIRDPEDGNEDNGSFAEDREKSRRSHRERSSSRTRDRDRRDRDRDRSRDRSRFGSRDRDAGARRDRDRDYRRRGSSRDRSSRDRRDRDTRGRGRGRYDRSASPPARSSRRRYRSSSSSDSDKDHKRNRSARSAESPAKDSNLFRPVTLKEIITANPGMSMPEAIIRLNAHNSALAKGIPPPPLAAAAAPQLTLSGLATDTAGAYGAVPQAPALTSLTGGARPPLPTTALNALAAVTAAAGGSFGLTGDGGPATKPHRELYVGNLPPGITVGQLTEFVNTAFKQLGLSKDGGPVVIAAWVSPDQHYAFVEMKSIEDATTCLSYLNGIQVGAFNLKIGRPKGYTGPVGIPGTAGLVAPNPLMMGFGAAPALGGLGSSLGGLGAGFGGLGAGLSGTMGASGSMGSFGAASTLAGPMSNAVMVTNLPSLITDDQVKELFSQFGVLNAFNSIKTAGSDTQTAVLEFVDGGVVDGVVTGMNNLDIAGKKLSVQRIPASSAAVLLQPVAAPTTAVTVTDSTAAATATESTAGGADADDIISEELKALPPSTVLCLGNMVTSEDLSDDELYAELIEDVSDECNRYGVVVSIVIPRPTGDINSDNSDSSIGRIFVLFTEVKGAEEARKAVEGRKFNGRVVKAFFFPAALYTQKIYVVPSGYEVTASGSDAPTAVTTTAATDDEALVDGAFAAAAIDPYMPDDIEGLD